MIARRLLQRPRTNSASHPCVGSTVSIVCDGLVTADSARLPDFVSAVARNVTYASVGREALLPFRITEYRRSCADFMFLANASSAELESCWDARHMLALPLSVADTLRDWATACCFSAGSERCARPEVLRSIVAIIDAYVWQYDPTMTPARLVGEWINVSAGATGPVRRFACGHSERVARLSTRIAEQLGCKGRQLTTMYVAGLLHDVGKVGVDTEILHKPGKLTEEEYGQVKTHPEVGYEMLLGIEPLSDVLPAVLSHHEQWNGGGYPHGLAGEEIPLIARIAAVADAHDAMTSDRPYRDSMPRAQVRRVFEEGAAIHWDPVVVDAYYAITGDCCEQDDVPFNPPRCFASHSNECA